MPWSSASTTRCRLRHINTANMPATAQPCILKRCATIAAPNSHVNHVSLRPNSAAIVGIASGRMHDTLTLSSSQTCLQPSKSVTTSKLQQCTLPTPAIIQAIKHRESPAKPAELDGARRTPQPVSLALHHRSQEKRYPDDRHIISRIRTYPPSSNVRIILALGEF